MSEVRVIILSYIPILSTYPNGRKVILSNAMAIRKLMSASSLSSSVSSSPTLFKCLGVATLRANTSPTASWKPAPRRGRGQAGGDGSGDIAWSYTWRSIFIFLSSSSPASLLISIQSILFCILASHFFLPLSSTIFPSIPSFPFPFLPSCLSPHFHPFLLPFTVTLPPLLPASLSPFPAPSFPLLSYFSYPFLPFSPPLSILSASHSFLSPS